MSEHSKCRGPHDNWSKQKLPVFSDPTHSRSRRIKIFASVSVLIILLWATTLGLHLFKSDQTAFDLSVLPAQTSSELFAANTVLSSSSDALPDLGNLQPPATQEYIQPTGCAGLRYRKDSLVDGSRDIYAFLTAEPAWSYTALEAHCAQIDVLVPAWFEISGSDQKVVDVERQFVHFDSIHSTIAKYRNHFALMPALGLQEWTESP